MGNPAVSGSGMLTGMAKTHLRATVSHCLLIDSAVKTKVGMWHSNVQLCHVGQMKHNVLSPFCQK